MPCLRKVDDDLSKELDLQIKGAEKPSIWYLLGIRFILLPYTIAKVRAPTSVDDYYGIGLNFLINRHSYCMHTEIIEVDLHYAIQELLNSMLYIQLLLWHGGWFWRYQIKKAPYSWEDASYLTQRSLGVPHESWRYMGKRCIFSSCRWGCKSLFHSEAFGVPIVFALYSKLLTALRCE